MFDAWSFDRCLWGTDWTRAFAFVNYEQGVEPFRLTDRLSEGERAMLMGGTCAKVTAGRRRKISRLLKKSLLQVTLRAGLTEISVEVSFEAPNIKVQDSTLILCQKVET